MSRGYPDYFGLSIFTKFGPIKKASNIVSTIADGGTSTVFQITAKGKLYGGHLRLWNQSDASEIQFLPAMDGTPLYTYNLQDLLDYQIGVEDGYLFRISNFNPVAKEFTVIAMKDITFDSSIDFAIENNTGGVLSITGVLYYAQVI